MKFWIRQFYVWIVISGYFILILYQNKKIIVEHIHNTLTVPCEKSKTVFFASSIIKYIAVCPAWSRSLVKLICCIAVLTCIVVLICCSALS